MSAGIVYHYTDTLRLPWILQSGELRAGRNRFGGFPDPDFLWASTVPIPDGTAASAGPDALTVLREGLGRTVRFTLCATDFRPWRDITADFPVWTPSEMRRLEKAVRGKSNPKDWMCWSKSLTVERWLSVETRGAVDDRWSPLNTGGALVVLGGNVLGVNIDGDIYAAERVFLNDVGVFGYRPTGVFPVWEMMLRRA